MNKFSFRLIKPRSIFLLAVVACLGVLAVSSATAPPGPLVIITKSLPPAITGQSYSFLLTASGGTPAYKWNGATNSPEGSTNSLTITPGGVLSGTPVYSGIFPLLVQVTDANGVVSTVQFNLTVNGGGSPKNIGNSPPVPGGQQGVFYDFTFFNPLGAFCQNFKFIEGNIPPGLNLNGLGHLSGVPLLAGTYTFSLSEAPSSSACASSVPSATNIQTFTITITPHDTPPLPLGGSGWVRNSGNPVLPPFGSAAWDDFMVSSPSVVKNLDGSFNMYYEGEDSATHTRRIGLATSLDGVAWTHSSTPVLTPGAAGSFDSLEVRFPSVHFDGTTNTYRMWYWGSNGGCNQIGLATSSNGVAWVKNATPVALGSCGFGNNYAPGSVVRNAGTFTMWYWIPLGGIGKATSPDGITWTDNGFVSFTPGFDSGVSLHRPSVVQEGSTYRMWFSKTNGYVLVGDSGGFDLFKSNIGYATSTDGLHWSLVQDDGGNGFATMFVAGPAGAWDRPGVGEPSIVKDGSTYKMWYTGGRINLPLPEFFSFVEGSIGYATVAGASTPATLAVAPTGPIAYGTAPVGGTPVDKTFIIQNTGDVTLTGNVSTSSPFSIASGGTISLPGGQSQPVVVRFTPTTATLSNGTVSFSSNGGSASVAVTGTGSTAPPATITSFTPTSGTSTIVSPPTPGTVVTITGTNFVNVQSVAFNGVPAVSPTIVSATSIKATVPAGATTGTISVTTLTNPATSSVATPFKVLPKITGFTPTSGKVNDVLTINGSGFTGVSAVKFGTVSVAATFISDTQITATVPLLTTVTSALSVVAGTTMVIATGSFTFIQSPTITSFAPPNGPVGTVVTIMGTKLTGTTQATFTGAAPVACTTVTATSVTVTVPPGAQNGPIILTNIAGSPQTATNFTVAPSITSFTPLSGKVSDPITINGYNLTGATAKFGNVSSTTVTPVSDTQITATVPGGATTGPISVAVGTATATSAGIFTTILGPTISSFTPLTGPVGAVITINGTNLTGTTLVNFTGASVPPTNVTATSLTVAVPAGATTGTITVTNPVGTSPLFATQFKVSPTITGFSPPSGVAGFNSVVITGSNFTGATAVKFGTIIASFTFNSDTQITATVPLTAVSAKISVTTAAGTATSLTNFVVLVAPTVTSFTPALGAVGTLVTITGTHLDGITDVKFNGVDAGAPTTIVSATSIKATVPVGASTGSITVTNAANPPITVPSATAFKVLPQITGFSPPSGNPGDPVVITGNSFTGATGPAAVKFGAVNAASYSVDSDTQITATVPAAAVTGKLSVTVGTATATSVASFTVSSLQSDLVVTTVTIPASVLSVSSGQSIPVTNAVKNQGNTAAGAFTVGIYLSTDNTIDPTVDRLLATRSVASLAAGAISSAVTAVTIPADVTSGTYFLGVVADTAGTVAELSESNNSGASIAIPITLLRTLTITKTGSGTVTSSPVGLTCALTTTPCTVKFPDGTPVSLSTSVGVFAGWSGDCSGAGSCTVTMNAPRNVLVAFSASGTGTTALSGTAARGNPIVGATVTLIDRNGQFATGPSVTTLANGSYSFTSAQVGGLSLPFLLKVHPLSGGPDLFSIATQFGTVNIDPYTDLITRIWYGSQGIPVDSMFDAFTKVPGIPPPTAVELPLMSNAVEDFLTPWFIDNGLSPATFDLFTTPFTAVLNPPGTPTGFDKVLDATTTYNVGPSTITLALTGVRTENVTVSMTANAFTVAATTTQAGETSASNATYIVPADPAIRNAMNGILLTLTNMATVVNAKKTALAASDLLPFFDANYLDRGFNVTLGSARLANDLRGETLNSFRIDRILSFDPTNQVLSLVGTASITIGTVTAPQVVDENGSGFRFKQGVDGVWRMYGSQQIAQAQVHAAIENRFSGLTGCGGPGGSCDGAFKTLDLQVQAPENTVTAASVFGTAGTLGDSAPSQATSVDLVPSSFVNVETINPTPTTSLDIRSDQFNTPDSQQNGGIVQAFPPVGTLYSFTVTPASGPVQTYNVTMGATTSDVITYTTPFTATATHTYQAAKLGTALTVNWTLPTTFPIRSVDLNGFVAAEGVGCDVHGTITSQTSGTITLPTNCGGIPILPRATSGGGPAPAQITVVFTGTHGEETRAWWAFGTVGAVGNPNNLVNPQLTVLKVGNGTVTGSSSSPASVINCGTVCTQTYPLNLPNPVSPVTVTLTATPLSGAFFTGWSGAGCSGTGTCVVTMDDNHTVTANFTTLVALTVTRTGVGTVTSSPTGINCPPTCTFNFPAGTAVSLTQTPTGGSAFTSWSGACTGTGACNITLNAAAAVTAAFTTPPALTVALAGTGTGSVTSAPAGISCGADCTQTYANGAFVTLSATPGLGSTFTGWSGGVCTGTGSCAVSMTAAKSVTATFTLAVGVPPPPGSFSNADLAGTWNLYVLTSPEVSTDGGRWDVGTVTFNASGLLTSGGFTKSSAGGLNQAVTFSSGSATVTANGAVTGVLSNTTPNVRNRTLIATMLPTKDQIMGVATARDGTTGAVLRNGIFYLLKQPTTPATTFSASDLAGTWRSNALSINSIGIGSWGYGTRTIDGGGNTTNGSVIRPDGSTITLSTATPYTITSSTTATNGTIQGVVTGSDIPVPLTRTIIASMAPSKDRIVGVQTISNGSTTVGVNLITLVKTPPSPTIAPGDLAGSWRLYALATASSADEGGGWGAGTFAINSSPSLTSGQFVTSGDGNLIVLNSAPFTMDANGILSGTLPVAGGGTLTIPNAILVPSKDGVLGVFTFQSSDNGQTKQHLGLFGMVKDNPALPPSLTVVKVGAGSGTVVSNLSGINCGTDCAESYPAGTLVTLTATPAAGSTFAGWSGGVCSGTGACNVTLSNSTIVNATFTAPNFNFQLVFSHLQGCFDGTLQGTFTNLGSFATNGCSLGFPVSMGYYFVNFNVNDDSNPPEPGTVTFNGPSGSGLPVLPAPGVQPQGIFLGTNNAGYGSPSVCFPGVSNGPSCSPTQILSANSPPGGNYVVNYKGPQTFTLVPPLAANFQAGGHALVAIPTAHVVNNVLTSLDWQYQQPVNGTPVTPPPAFIASTEVRVQGFQGNPAQDSSLYNAQGLPATAQSHILGSTVNWLDVTQVQIVYTDNLGNQYVSYWQRANVPAPTITQPLSPASGPVGTSVTITGTNFGVVGQSGAAKAVRFNGTLALYNIVSSTQITAIVPAGATTGPVTVETIGGLSNQDQSFAVTGGGLSVSVVGSGTVTSDNAHPGINCSSGTCNADFTAGATITLTAAPTGGSVFAGWSGACANTSGTCTVTLNGPAAVTAIFQTQSFGLNVTKAGNGFGFVSSSPAGINCGTICAGSFGSGTVTLTATPSPGSTFAVWSGCDSITSGACNVTMSAAKSVTAGFAAIAVGVTPVVTTVSSDPNLTNPSAITISGSTLYVGNGVGIFSVPTGGGAATQIQPNATPCCVVGLTLIGSNLYWIDPNGDPDATAIFKSATSGGQITKIYSGFATGQPIVDGVSIATDGTKLYTSDEVQGRVHSMNPNGSGITQLASRYGGFFNTEHFSSIAVTPGGSTLYIAESGQRKDVLPPQIVTIPTTGGSPTVLYSGAPFVNLTGIAVSATTIYVVDQGANTIWQMPIAGGTPTVLASGAPFVQISGIVYDGVGALYVTDTGNVGSTDGPGKIYKVGIGTTAQSFSLAVTLAGAGAGTVTSSPVGIACSSSPCNANFIQGASVTLTATAGTGSTFSGWSGDCTGTGTCTVTMNPAHNVTATFAATGAAGAFATGDLAGTWNVYSMTTTKLPGQLGGWVNGTVTIGNTGLVTVGSLLPFGGSSLPVTGGSFAMSAQGVLTGTVSTGSGATATTRIINGTMAASKDQMATVFILRNDATGVEMREGLTVLVKQSTGFAQSDLQGTWRSYALTTSAANGTGSWGFGIHTNDSNGNLTSGSVTRSDGTVIPLTGGTRTIASDGTITGTVTSAGIIRTIDAASMAPSKDRIVGVETIRDANNNVLSVGMFSAVKDASGFASPDVVGTWRFYALATPGTAGQGGGWGAGALTFGSDGTVSGSLLTTGDGGKVLSFTSGAGSVDANGVFTGTLNTSDGEAISLIAGLTSPSSKDWLPGVFTLSSTDSGKKGLSFGEIVMVKEDPAGLPTLSVFTFGPGSGTVTSIDGFITCGVSGVGGVACAKAYSSGTSVTLTATPGAGTTFGGWAGCDSTSNGGLSCTVSVNATRFVSAAFGPQINLSFLHFANAGNFGAGVVPSVSYPVFPGSYSAGLNVSLDSSLQPDGTTILVTGPNGSGMTNSPANFYHQVQATQAFYSTASVSNPTFEPAGSWSVTYKGTPHTITVPDPQIPAHVVVPIPAANVVNGVLQSVSWSYKDSFGNTLPGPPSFMTGIQVQVNDQCGQIYDSPFDLPPSTTSHTLTSTVQWGIVGGITMAYNDTLGNHYVISFQKGSSQCAPPTITGFSPGGGPVGTAVTITGTNFASNATGVHFFFQPNVGINANNFTVNSSTSITAIVPAQANTGAITVTTPNGAATSANSFTVTP